MNLKTEHWIADRRKILEEEAEGRRHYLMMACAGGAILAAPSWGSFS